MITLSLKINKLFYSVQSC